MFFSGTLQEGIATSIQQNKALACFVTDEGPESQVWETEYLKDPALRTALRDDAVVLRLTAGSEEADHLSAISPMGNFPRMVMIKNRAVISSIFPGVPQKDFVSLLSAGFELAASIGLPAAQPNNTSSPPDASPIANQDSPAAQPTTSETPPALQPPRPEGQQHEVTSSSSSGGPATPTHEEDSAASVRNVLAERRARLEAQRREAEHREKEARAAKAQADAQNPSPEALEKRRRTEALRKQRQEAADERARILRRIEDDRLERQARSARPKEPKLGDVAAALANAESSSMRPTNTQATVRVRLFDGSSLRTRFESSKASLKDVRKWVDDGRTDGTDPYVFKLVSPPPQPSRRIDETEEGKTLSELEMVPSATLMLAPVKKYAEAYDTSPRGILGFLFSPVGYLLGFFAWLWGLLTGLFTGTGARGDGEREQAREQERRDKEREELAAHAARVREQRNGRFAQFANPDDRRGEQQLYNGNSLNFEPRPDDEKDE